MSPQEGRQDCLALFTQADHSLGVAGWKDGRTTTIELSLSQKEELEREVLNSQRPSQHIQKKPQKVLGEGEESSSNH